MLVLIAIIDDIQKKHSQRDVIGAFFTTVGYTKYALMVSREYNIDCNTLNSIKSFAVHIAGNVLIKPKPLKLRAKPHKPQIITT